MLRDLTYRVVVIDDEIDLYDDYVEYIQEILEKEGYLLESDRYESLEELEGKQLQDVDLFLVDLKFGKEDLGPRFIEKIRENYLTDILFYSSDAKAIQENKKSGNYQGVFFAVRDEYSGEIYGLLKRLLRKMIKRANTPISTRGIVLSGVAELDTIIKQQIAELTKQIAPDCKNLMDGCTNIYYESFKGQAKNIKKFWNCDFHKGLYQWNEVKAAYGSFDIVNLVENIRITDSNKNFKVLLKVYKELKGEDEIYNNLNNFTALLADRNILAHVSEEVDEEGHYQFYRVNKGDYLVLTEDVCRELRLAIIQYAELLKKMSS